MYTYCACVTRKGSCTKLIPGQIALISALPSHCTVFLIDYIQYNSLEVWMSKPDCKNVFFSC